MVAGYWRHREVDEMSFHHLVEIHELMNLEQENRRRLERDQAKP